MTSRTLICVLIVLLAIGCSGSDESTPKSGPADTPTAQPGTDTKADNMADNRGTYGLPVYLGQNWDHDIRMEWWYSDQGSRVLPYDWFLVLEQVGSKELVRTNANLVDRLRFIYWPADDKWNPDGLPIGFVKDTDAKTNKSYFGFTCAACHTSLIESNGKMAIVEGGPAHADFDKLVTEIGDAMQATVDDGYKFARFSKALLGDSANQAMVDALKTELKIQTAELTMRTKVNRPPHPNGYARLDAFGNIFNEGSVFAIDEPANVKPANAPVSYPVLWDTPQHEIVQWNGAAVNAGIGPYTRNIGEVVGVFGGLRVRSTDVLGNEKMRYDHHVDVAGLERLEEILTTLWSPEWPENMLGKLDQAKVTSGRLHYSENCARCHAVVVDRTDPNRVIGEQMIPATTVGTDPLAVMNPATSMSVTGILEGKTILPLTQYLPARGLLGGKFEAEAPTKRVVGNGVIGILREERPKVLVAGLLDYIKAAKANPASTTPSYKARPLNGIWSSAPFLHNGSVPNLAELLKKPADRVSQFSVGSWEMDIENVGFVTTGGPNTSVFDTSLPGNSNRGHDYGTDLADNEKHELLEYIKSL